MSPNELRAARDKIRAALDADSAAHRAELRRLYEYYLSAAREAEAVHNDPTAKAIAKKLRTLLAFVVRDAKLLDLEAELRRLRPQAAHGASMDRGRKVGTIGKVRKFLRIYMAKHRTASAADAWKAFKARPPKGCELYEKPVKYILTKGAPDTSYRQFANLVSMERPK